MKYRALILDGEYRDAPGLKECLARLGTRVIHFAGEGHTRDFIETVRRLAPQEVMLAPAAPGVRCRIVEKDNCRFVIVFNEATAPARFELQLAGGPAWYLLDTATGTETAADLANVAMEPMQLMVFRSAGGS